MTQGFAPSEVAKIKPQNLAGIASGNKLPILTLKSTTKLGCTPCNLGKPCIILLVTMVQNAVAGSIQRRISQWERKKQEKVGEKLEEKNSECVLKSDTERTNDTPDWLTIPSGW